MKEWKIGDVSIKGVIESEGPWPGTFVLPNAVPENVLKERDWLSQFTDSSGKLIMSIHPLVLESQGRQDCGRYLYRQR